MTAPTADRDFRALIARTKKPLYLHATDQTVDTWRTALQAIRNELPQYGWVRRIRAQRRIASWEHKIATVVVLHRIQHHAALLASLAAQFPAPTPLDASARDDVRAMRHDLLDCSLHVPPRIRSMVHTTVRVLGETLERGHFAAEAPPSRFRATGRAPRV